MTGQDRSSFVMAMVGRAFKTLPWHYKVVNFVGLLMLALHMLINKIKGMMGMLNYPRPVVRELLPNVWQARGVTVGTINTMTIFKLESGGLLLFNVLKPTDDLVAQVTALGRVEAILVVSLFHDSHFGSWVDALDYKISLYAPEAAIPYLETIKPIDGTLEENAELFDATVIDATVHLTGKDKGHTDPMLVVTCGGNRILVINDIICNIPADEAGLLNRLMGFTGLRMVRQFYNLFVSDHLGMQRLITNLATNEAFDCLVMSHGPPISGGPAAVRKALLDAAQTFV